MDYFLRYTLKGAEKLFSSGVLSLIGIAGPTNATSLCDDLHRYSLQEKPELLMFAVSD